MGGTTAYSNSDFNLARFNTNGTLDVSFGKSGVAITDAGSDNDVLRAVAIQANVSEMCRNQVNKKRASTLKPLSVLAPPAGLEPATL